jgi:hypothetical protein
MISTLTGLILAGASRSAGRIELGMLINHMNNYFLELRIEWG